MTGPLNDLKKKNVTKPSYSTSEPSEPQGTDITSKALHLVPGATASLPATDNFAVNTMRVHTPQQNPNNREWRVKLSKLCVVAVLSGKTTSEKERGNRAKTGRERERIERIGELYTTTQTAKMLNSN